MSLRKQTLWSMAPLLVVTALNLVSVPLFYKYLGAELYALWFYVITFTGVFGFMDLGLGVTVGRYIGVELGQGRTDRVKAFWGTGHAAGLVLLLLFALAFGVLGAWGGPQWFNVDPGKVGLLRTAFIAGACGVFLSYYGQFWQILAQTHLDFIYLAKLRTIVSLAQIIPSLILAKWTSNPVVLIGWSAFIGFVQVTVLVIHARRNYSLGFEWAYWDTTRLREMGPYMGKTFASLVLGIWSGGLDRLLLGRLAPPIDFAHYNIAGNVGGRILGLSQAVMGPVFHHTSRTVGAAADGGNSPARVFNEAFDFLAGWVVLGVVWVFCWQKPILSLWLGPETGPLVAPVFAPLITGFGIMAMANISGAQLGPLNRLGLALLFQISGGFLTLAGCWLGWHWGGLEGAAWGFLVSRLTYFLQDLTVIRLVGGGGWLARKTWFMVGGQVLLGTALAFLASWLPSHPAIVWLLAASHGGMAALWLSREFWMPWIKKT
jgi:O-antigen/teichoic acid export membrane protein